MRKLTHEEFLDKLYNQNEYYRRGEIALEGEYIDTQSKITVIDFRLIRYSIKCSDLLKNARPNIKTAIDKSEYAKTMLSELHGDRYNYDKVKYVDVQTPITVVCPIHGDFDTSFNAMMGGSGCKKCSYISRAQNNTLNGDDVVERSKLIHGNRYTYENFVYVNAVTKGIINCPIHGPFYQTPNGHLDGRGCIKCQYKKISELIKDRGCNASYSQWGKVAEKSKNFDSFKVYIAICKDENETFIKVGKTFTTLDVRFKAVPYEYTIHKLIVGDNSINISQIEHSIKMDLKEYRYKTEKHFNGKFECFNINILHNGILDELIKNYKNVAAG